MDLLLFILTKYFFFNFRDVSGVELLMNNHQSLKAEIDARGDNFSACIALGKELLSRGHYATPEVTFDSSVMILFRLLSLKQYFN